MAYSPNDPPTLKDSPQGEKRKRERINLIRQADTNGDGRYSNKEIRQGIKERTQAIKAESCEMSTAAEDAERAAFGMTNQLFYSEGKEYTQMKAKLQAGLSKTYNEGLGNPLFEKAFPGGVDGVKPSDFKEMAKAIGDKIRECGLSPLTAPYPDNPNNEYAQNTLPPKPDTPKGHTR